MRRRTLKGKSALGLRAFVNRPIVAMVIAIPFVFGGLVSLLGLPVAQFPNIVT
jgi:multidrug efflux pump subunit AcrB